MEQEMEDISQQYFGVVDVSVLHVGNVDPGDFAVIPKYSEIGVA